MFGATLHGEILWCSRAGGKGEGWRGLKGRVVVCADLVVGGDLSSISLVGEAVLQALFQLVHMLLHIVNASSGPLHSPAMLSLGIQVALHKALCPFE